MNPFPAEKSVRAFMLWQAGMSNDDYTQIIYRGHLNRAAVAKGCGFSKTVLKQNPQVKKLLAQLELDLRQKRVLPDLTEVAQAAAAQTKIHNRTEGKQSKESHRIAELEAKVLMLEAKLQRFQDLSDVLVEMGLGELL